MNILITGSAGFIGFNLAKNLLSRELNIVGLDNHNDYYDPKLKEHRLDILTKYKKIIHIIGQTLQR